MTAGGKPACTIKSRNASLPLSDADDDSPRRQSRNTAGSYSASKTSVAVIRTAIHLAICAAFSSTMQLSALSTHSIRRRRIAQRRIQEAKQVDVHARLCDGYPSIKR